MRSLILISVSLWWASVHWRASVNCADIGPLAGLDSVVSRGPVLKGLWYYRYAKLYVWPNKTASEWNKYVHIKIGKQKKVLIFVCLSTKIFKYKVMGLLSSTLRITVLNHSALHYKRTVVTSILIYRDGCVNRLAM